MEPDRISLVLREITAHSEPSAMIERAVDAVVSLLNPDHVGIYIYEAGQDRLVLAALNSSYGPGIPLGLVVNPGEGPIGETYASCRPRHDPNRQVAAKEPGVSPLTRSHCVLPLISSGGRQLGVLDVQSPRADAFHPTDIGTLALIAEQSARWLGLALRAQDEAGRSELLGGLLDAAVTGVVMVNRDGVVRHASGRLLTMLGLEPNGRGPAGRTYRRFFWPRLAASLERPSRYPPARAGQLMSHGREIEEDLRLSGQVEMIIRRRCLPVRDDRGQIAGRIEIFEDVTTERIAAKRLQASAWIARALTASFDLPSVFSGLARGLAAAIDFDYAVCYMRGAGQTVRVARIDRSRPDGPELGIVAPQGHCGQACCPVATPVVLSDLAADGSRYGPSAELLAMGMRQAVVLPLAAGANHCGVLAVGMTHPVPRYNQGTLDTLVPVAEFLALAVNNARLFEEVTNSGENAREEAAWASALLDMARAVASSTGLQETCSAGAAVLRRLFDHSWAIITTHDKGRGVHVVGHVDCPAGHAPYLGGDLSPPVIKLIEAASDAGGVLTMAQSEDGSDLPRGARSLAVAPLRTGDELTGSIILGFAHQRGLTGERERAILLGLAHQMGLGIQQAELLAAAKQQANLLSGISRASRRLAGSLDLEVVLDEVIGFLSRDERYEWVGIYLRDKSTGTLVLRANSGRLAPLVTPGECIPPGVGLVGTAASTGEPVVVNDVTNDSRFTPWPGVSIASEMCVPLKFDGQVLGVLDVESGHKNAFSGHDVLTVQTLSDHLAIAINNAHLYQHVRRLHLATTQSLVQAMETRDPYTRGHGVRVSEFAVAIGCRLQLPPAQVEELRLAGLLHDVGKIVVEDRVLAKRGPLDSVERALVMEHSIAGAGILQRTEALASLAPLIRWHHEWHGGGGYPDGIKGDAIPLGARILAVADAFDAMTSDRPYRTALPVSEALDRLTAGVETQFDPVAVRALLDVVAEARQCGSALWVDLSQRVEASRQEGGVTAVGNDSLDQPGRILPVHGRALNIMYRVSLETGSILQRQQLLQRILGILHDTMGKHKYVILLTEPGSGDLVVEAEIGFGKSHHMYTVPAGEGVTGWVAEHGVPLLVKDVENDPRYHAGPSQGIRSELAVPLVARGRVIGVLDIESEVANAFTTEDLYLITAVAGQISTAIEVSQQHEQVARAAILDGLTGLYNHSHFYRRLDEEMSRSRRHGRPLVVGLMDVNDLKAVNDVYGHLGGDAALREIAACLRSKLRRSDVVARYGGDEFGLIMPDTDLPDAGQVAERFQAELRERRFRLERHDIALPTVAVGLASFPREGDSAAILVSLADERLYAQKRVKDIAPSMNRGLRSTRTA